ncbi:MAG TPA: hypothetical protein VGL86_24235 [Polyangia bacterium]|jgi:hypothetical protein
MRELRASAAGDGDAAVRAELRVFAAEWPGALKELDTLPTDEIERRARVCAAGGDEPWMSWSLRYHELMRAALAIRRGEAIVGGSELAVDEEFARAVKRPAHGRINVVVFAALAREFDVTAREIWDALFPRRGRAARDYR